MVADYGVDFDFSHEVAAGFGDAEEKEHARESDGDIDAVFDV